MNIELTTALAAITPVTNTAPAGANAGSPDAGGARSIVPYTGAPAGASADDWAEAEESLRALGATLEEFRISLNFSRDEESGAVVVRLVDEGTGETIRQIPTEVALRLTAAFGKLQGLIYNRRA